MYPVEHLKTLSGTRGCKCVEPTIRISADAHCHEANYPLSQHHLRQSNTDMGIGKSLSKLKKKIKHGLGGTERKPDRTGAKTVGERADPTGSLLRPESPVVSGGGSAVQPLQSDKPGSVLVRGAEGDQEGGEAHIDGEANQERLDLHPDVGVVVGSEPSRDADREEVGQVHPSPSTTSIPHSGEPDST